MLKVEIVSASKLKEGDRICVAPGRFEKLVKFEHVYEEEISALFSNNIYYVMAPTDEVVRVLPS